MDYNTNTYTLENVCSAAAIYGLDGSCWAFSPNFPELKDYPFELEGMDGGKQTIQVSELGSAIAAANGTRNPTAAGTMLKLARGYCDRSPKTNMSPIRGDATHEQSRQQLVQRNHNGLT